MEYILKTYPEEIDEALEGSEYYQHFMKTFKINCRKEVDVKDAAGILAGKCELSHRRYKALREVLQNSNVLLPSYDIVSTYVKGIDVGHLYPLHEKNACECMGYGSSLNDSLQQMVNNDLVYNKLEFLTEEKQKKLGDFLKLNDPKLYKNFNYSEKTLFLRETADNFRGSARQPTEQSSYSIMNLKDLLSSPYGQIISTLWRGSESRKNFDSHVLAHYKEVKNAVENGVTLHVNGSDEFFNIVVFLVADLSCVKELLGRCSVSHTYGCFYCNLNSNDWDAVPKIDGSTRKI